MINQTRREAIESTRKMWTWGGDNKARDKDEYFKAHPELEIPRSNCYICEYCSKKDIPCAECLLIWSKTEEGGGCYADNSPYQEWLCSNTPEDKAKYAYQIANLPEREENN